MDGELAGRAAGGCRRVVEGGWQAPVWACRDCPLQFSRFLERNYQPHTEVHYVCRTGPPRGLSQLGQEMAQLGQLGGFVGGLVEDFPDWASNLKPTGSTFSPWKL